MSSLEEKKEKIVNHHIKRIIDINNQILKLTSNAIRDKKTQTKCKASFLNVANAVVSFTIDESLSMTSQDKLEYAKLWFKNAENMRNSIKADKGFYSLLNDIDEQLKLCRQELDLADKELKNII
jgi:hypothetical protein